MTGHTAGHVIRHQIAKIGLLSDPLKEGRGVIGWLFSFMRNLRNRSRLAGVAWVARKIR